MGYYERKAAGAGISALFTIVAICLIAVGPWMIGNAAAGPALGWTFEGIYIAAIVGLVTWAVRAGRRKEAAAAAERADREAFRYRMALSNEPWFDAESAHYRHSTCTTKHRSLGAAARCSSRI